MNYETHVLLKNGKSQPPPPLQEKKKIHGMHLHVQAF